MYQFARRDYKARTVGMNTSKIVQSTHRGVTSFERAFHRAVGNQKTAQMISHRSPISPRIQRRWDAAATQCADQPTDKWIERVVVEQKTPQSVTVHWSDGTQESDQCSSGKGHCCVDPANPDGVACTQAQSTRNGSNCTPITRRMGYPVRNRDLDHNGVLWWTEFVPSRGIALHEYRPVDGTPLSHGCVRLHHDMAVKIFCGARQNQTWVKVQGFARPMCDQANLQSAWAGDFSMGGRNLSDHDGDSDMQASIREARRMLNAAFGRTLTVEEIRSLGPSDIPRCTGTVARPTTE
jgi:hypothetical protein